MHRAQVIYCAARRPRRDRAVARRVRIRCPRHDRRCRDGAADAGPTDPDRARSRRDRRPAREPQRPARRRGPGHGPLDQRIGVGLRPADRRVCTRGRASSSCRCSRWPTPASCCPRDAFADPSAVLVGVAVGLVVGKLVGITGVQLARRSPRARRDSPPVPGGHTSSASAPSPGSASPCRCSSPAWPSTPTPSRTTPRSASSSPRSAPRSSARPSSSSQTDERLAQREPPRRDMIGTPPALCERGRVMGWWPMNIVDGVTTQNQPEARIVSDQRPGTPVAFEPATLARLSPSSRMRNASSRRTDIMSNQGPRRQRRCAVPDVYSMITEIDPAVVTSWRRRWRSAPLIRSIERWSTPTWRGSIRPPELESSRSAVGRERSPE